MKNFEMPTAEVIALDVVDIITTSFGDEWSDGTQIIYH